MSKKSFPRIYMELHKLLKEFAFTHGEPGKITRHLGFLWMEDELGGLNPTPEQRRKVIALATQMGMQYGDARAFKHCHVLDFILDRITEHLCPEEWAANEARRREEWQRAAKSMAYGQGQCEVFAAYYGGDNERLRELGIDPSELGGRRQTT
jgi:hypothetical protein